VKVRAREVPADSLSYLTPGKEYEVLSKRLDEDSGEIIDDRGHTIFIYFAIRQ